MAQIIFMGTPDFAVPILNALIEHHTVIGVVTQPDRPVGRKGEVRQPPVKQTAQQHGIPVFQPEKIRQPHAIDTLRAMGVPDAYVVAAFGQILPKAVLDIPPHGSVNVHASLLPRWRGAAPIQAAIREGDDQTGITIMQMDEGLDTGPMLAKAAIKITPHETGSTLHDKLSELGATLLIQALPAYLSGNVTPTPQDDTAATLAPQIQKKDGQIDWTSPAAHTERLVRAFTPWPGTYTFWQGKRLKILGGSVGGGREAPGRVVLKGDALAIGTGDGLFYPHQLQLAGSRALAVTDFINGHGEIIGATLGE
jgi:methionyl-tRNA formyltransferase